MYDFTKIQSKLGYHFVNTKLLHQALSHRSYSNINNERLEFLGDSIVNFVMASVLYQRYEDYSEGKLSNLRAYLVKGETLSVIGATLGLSDFVFLGPGELKSGGHKRKSIIANCVEALIAAIYIDSNSMVTCQNCVLKWFDKYLSNLDSIKYFKDPKTRLQEFMQAQKLLLPVYELVKIGGDGNEQIFEVSCSSPLLHNQKIKGLGNSRRNAEQNAASKMLELLEPTHEKRIDQ